MWTKLWPAGGWRWSGRPEATMPNLKVTWRKSAIGYPGDQKRTIRALGLRRLGQSVQHSDSRVVRGMILKVRHLVVVEEVAE